MSGWWSKAVSAVGDKIGLDEETQAAVTNAGTSLGSKVGGIVTHAKEHVAEMSADSERWQQEADARRQADEQKQQAARLPWELDPSDEAKSILSQDLMERVLALSLDEHTFLDPTPNVVFDFDFEAHVPVIMRLLELDPNLAKMHSRLAPKVDEHVFWRRFFLRCAQLRASVGVGMPLPMSTAAVDASPPRGGGGAAGGSAGDASSSDGSGELINKDELLREMADEGASSAGGGEPAKDAAAAEEDAALEAEVQAELERGADAALDDSFDAEAELCSELEGLDADGDGLEDDELEAQIAAELDDEDAAKAAAS